MNLCILKGEKVKNREIKGKNGLKAKNRDRSSHLVSNPVSLKLGTERLDLASEATRPYPHALSAKICVKLHGSLDGL